MTSQKSRTTGASVALAWSHAALFVVGMLLSSVAAAQASVSDSTFLDTNWTLTTFTSGNGGSVVAGQVASGGNPGAFRNVTDNLNAAPSGSQTIVLGASIYTPFTYAPATSGAIASLSYSEDAACTSGCFGNGQSTGPALLQNGNIYILSSSTVITGPGTTFVNHSLSALTAADFGLVNVTTTAIFDNTQHPNFSATGAPIQFGFFRANGTGINGGGYSLAAGIDNWQIVIAAAAPPPPTSNPAASIPTLGEWQLLLLALGVLVLGARYLRARS
ncbi:MAG: hypothetical protein ABIS17_12880 [Casimicrobiaceae bacterium]